MTGLTCLLIFVVASGLGCLAQEPDEGQHDSQAYGKRPMDHWMSELLGSIKRGNLKPNSLFNSFKRTGLKPNGLFGAYKRSSLKPNGLFGAYKRVGLTTEYLKPTGLYEMSKKSWIPTQFGWKQIEDKKFNQYVTDEYSNHMKDVSGEDEDDAMNHIIDLLKKKQQDASIWASKHSSSLN